ncbi:MMPL family transporter [Deinococcus cavernae]|uniref:MMPL family transporter n=1 Tax=Deinococcus cavernae TaxID=2320857 RepID=A0A418V7R2_9DEIO|nr:MMPL family transporter [Deinococcus cavernae]
MFYSSRVQLLSRLVSRHPWAVLIVWLVAALLSVPLAARAPSALTANAAGTLSDTESSRVITLLRDKFREKDTNMALLITRSNPPLNTPEGQANYAKFIEGLKDVQGVSQVVEARNAGTLSTQSADAVMGLTIAQIPLNDGATQSVRAIRQYAQKVKSPALDVRVTGGQAIADDFTEFAEKDTKRSEFVALPLIAALLLLVFGALVATGLPLVVGVLSITVAMAGLYGLTFLMEVSTFAQSVITMLGLGAGIDYALLMVNRFREELRRMNGDSRAASARTVLSAGRSVGFSGLTVAIAMAGLIIPHVTFVRSIGIGGVLVVLLTVLASITALPAMLTLLGERVNSPRILKIGWAQSGEASAGWTAFARRVTARPWLAFGLSSALLLLLSIPAWGMRVGYSGAWGIVPGVESRDALADVRKLGAGGLLSQFEVVLDLEGRRYGPDDRRKFQQLVEELRALPDTRGVLSPFVTSADLGGSTSNAEAIGALSALTRRSFSQDRQYLRVTVVPSDTLRADQIAEHEERIRDVLSRSGYRYLLGGAPIGEKEWSHQITGALPTVVAAVFAGTFLLLLVAFRSLLIPLKSILTNALTVGAAAGVVTEIVQNGLLAAPLGIPVDVGIIDASLPVMLFAVMFGLSMDYEIFLLSRVQEEHLRGKSNDEAVVEAIGHTARIITSAAIIMFIVFGAFVFGRVIASKSIGLGLAVAVLLDATLVRLVLVPSFLKLAGRWNWWLPGWLDRRLPQMHLEH